MSLAASQWKNNSECPGSQRKVRGVEDSGDSADGIEFQGQLASRSDRSGHHVSFIILSSSRFVKRDSVNRLSSTSFLAA